jgi:F-type H+-transporting ATPase subunit epsilon
LADMIAFELVSPASLLASGEASMVIAPGTEGDFAVMPGHAPIVATLRPGTVEVYESGDQPSARFFVAGGFAEVALDKFTVLAETAIPMDEVDGAHLEQQIQNTKEDLEDAGDDDEKRTAIEEKLAQLEDLLSAHG